MSQSKVVAVTGASGFVGSHIVIKLLQEGYSVRMIARGQKAEHLRETFAKANDGVEVISIADISSDDLETAFTGAWAVIHTASPLSSTADAQTMLKSAVQGTIHVVSQAVKYGVKKVVVTATWASLSEPGDISSFWNGRVLNESMWGEVKEEDVSDETMDPFTVYASSKLLSEKALWKFAEEHKEIDIAAINPPFIYGPYAKGFPLPTSGSKSDAGTNGMLLPLIQGAPDRDFPLQVGPSFVDVRDVATAHVRALQVGASPDNVRAKRYIVEGGIFLWKDAIALLSEKRPEIKGSLPDISKAPPNRPASVSDVSRARKDLGLTEYIGWQQTVLEAVDDLLRAQKSWA